MVTPSSSLSCLCLSKALLLLWATTTLVAFSVAGASPSPPPPIRARIQASWSRSPLLVQILETASLESDNSSLFFTHLEAITSLTSEPSLSLSSREIYQRSLPLLFNDIPSNVKHSALETFKLALAIREASPLIQTRLELYKPSDATSDLQGSVVVYNDKSFDDVETLSRIIEEKDDDASITSPPIYSFDIIHPSSIPTSNNVPTAILYADLYSTNLLPLHSALSQLSKQGRVRYIFRWKYQPSTSTSDNKLMLSAYGAGLDLKRVDYITIDDRDLGGQSEGGQGEPNPPSNESKVGIMKDEKNVNELFFSNNDGSNELVQVKPAQLEHIGLRASQLILSSASPLSTLRSLSQDFPKHAHKLSTLIPELSSSFLSEIQEMHTSYISAGKSLFWINGLLLRENEIRPFSLLRILRKERKTILALKNLGLSSSQAIDVLANQAIGTSFSATSADPSGAAQRGGLISVDMLGEIFDASDRRESHQQQQLILYWNDISKDSRYARWNPSLSGLLQPSYPGALPQVRKNLVNVILLMDLKKRDSHIILVENVAKFVSQGIPIRWGMVPLLSNTKGKEDVSEVLAKVVYYLIQKAGRAMALSFSRELMNSSSSDTLTIQEIRSAYSNLYKIWSSQQSKQNPSHSSDSSDSVNAPTLFETLDQIIKAELPDIETRLQAAKQYARRLGVSPGEERGETSSSEKLGHMFINGRYSPLDEDFRTNLQTSMNLQLQYLTQQLYIGTIDENTLDNEDEGKGSISNYFYDLPGTYKTRNEHVFPDDEKNPLRFVDVLEWKRTSGIDCGKSVEGQDSDSPIMSIWLLADTTSEAGRESIDQAGIYSSRNNNIRLCIVHNPSSSASFDETNEDGHTFEWHSNKPELGKEYISTAFGKEASRLGRVAASAVGLAPGDSGIVINGRIIAPLHAGSFQADDFASLVEYEKRKRLNPLVQALQEALGEHASEYTNDPDFIAGISSVISQAYQPNNLENLFNRPNPIRHRPYLQIPNNQTSFTLGNESSALFHIGVILDPLSETAQSWSSILETLAKMESVYIKVYLNPQEQISEMPLKRFYRYSWDSELSFDEYGAETTPSVLFEGIPPSTLLTLSMDVEPSWQAFPKESIHDLDNILLSDLKPSRHKIGVDAIFQLDNIIVEGHARESGNGAPPRGLQLQLSPNHNSSSALETNTLVMANLGYHQLKANPGLWDYSIRKGRSSQVFELDDDNFEGKGIERNHQISVTSFEGVTIFPKFKRRKGMEGIDLLDEDEEPQETLEFRKRAMDVVGSIKNRMQAFFSGTSITTTGNTSLSPTSNKGAEINIFTVASGLLYERMAMIMILSVLKHTNSSVKFWFINNFLSPSFKAFIPHLAKQYNFDYELVTYTWPHWLRGQKEKQRTIWGYKILFLDVLFPLDLDRVIFVDSDQIVRTDLKELVDLDLKGAPYGYAPMGDDREEMEGFRFWKTGYWRDHLRGRPYHISALYVIDLVRFRQIAAGDRLRGQYQSLSVDPNSLSNLDQDLPNNMQTTLPIYTLDRDWLWCETWCSDESLSRAKTIDLCNNPKTHEPKLQRAKRLIPEWNIYDKEIAELASRVAEDQRSIEKEGNQEMEADAFVDEAGRLEQARLQQKEFVQKGTGGRDTKHKKDEL